MSKRPDFYPDRPTLDREEPFADKFANSTTIDAIWQTGAKAFAEIPEMNSLKRLMLPDPKSGSIAFFESAMKEKRSLAAEIKETTKKAIERGIEVRWLREFPGYTMTIGDACGPNAWASVELALPGIHGGKHPSFGFNKKRHPETVKNMVEVFEALWDGEELSRTPEESELEEYGSR